VGDVEAGPELLGLGGGHAEAGDDEHAITLLDPTLTMILNRARIILMLTRSVALAAILSTTVLAGCGSTSEREVAAAFFPLAWVTEQVAGPDWEVTSLTQPGAEPHDLELGIAETAAIEQAELVVFEHEFQPAVDEAVANVATGEVVDAAEAVELRHLSEEEQHEHEEQGDGEHGSGEHEHGDGDLDPHFWLDPLLMADLGDEVASSLSDIDPEHAEDYAANAEQVRARLEKLDADYTSGLAECARPTMVVTHEAFGYLERYGLHFEGIAGLSPDAEPTPAVVARLQELIREEGITTVFSERLASPAMAEALAADTGVSTAVLDPVEGPSTGESGSDYVALMEQNLAALRKAGGC